WGFSSSSWRSRWCVPGGVGAHAGVWQDEAMGTPAPGRQLMVSTVDYATAGEPLRIVSGGVPSLRGATIMEKRRYALEHLDHIRQLLVFEPRGHADMYGGFVTDPQDDGAQVGVVFFHNAGYSTACGHGTIALVTWLIDAAIVPAGCPWSRPSFHASSSWAVRSKPRSKRNARSSTRSNRNWKASTA